MCNKSTKNRKSQPKTWPPELKIFSFCRWQWQVKMFVKLCFASAISNSQTIILQSSIVSPLPRISNRKFIEPSNNREKGKKKLLKTQKKAWLMKKKIKYWMRKMLRRVSPINFQYGLIIEYCKCIKQANYYEKYENYAYTWGMRVCVCTFNIDEEQRPSCVSLNNGELTRSGNKFSREKTIPRKWREKIQILGCSGKI